jgi:hypothetical protein
MFQEKVEGRKKTIVVEIKSYKAMKEHTIVVMMRKSNQLQKETTLMRKLLISEPTPM